LIPSSRVKNPKKGWIFTDVLGQSIGPTFEGQESKKRLFVLFGFLMLEDGANRVFRNVDKKLPLPAA
jgi:hypothetical protein